MTYALMQWACSHCNTVAIISQPMMLGAQTFSPPVCQCGHNYTFHGMEIVNANS